MVQALFSSLFSSLAKSIKAWLITWVKAQFNGNPLVENTEEYLGKVAQAVGVGVAGMLAIVPLAVLIYGGLIISVMKGWL